MTCKECGAWRDEWGVLHGSCVPELKAEVERLKKAICNHKRDVLFDNEVGCRHDKRLWAALEGKDG